MKTMPTSLFRVAILLVGVMGLLLVAGCRMPRFFAPPPPPTPPAPVTPAANLSQQAQDTVTAYVMALQKLDYTTAYGMLSHDAQTAHSRASFEEQAKAGLPSYDLKSASTVVTGDNAEVTLHLADEAGEHGFALVREAGAWKIDFSEGRPGMPYPASKSGEKSHESHP